MIVCYGDHEYSIFDSVSDHADYGPGNDCELHEAELVVKLDGHRGHYLGRDFIYEALLLLDIDNPDDTAILDKYENDYMEEVEPGFTVAECVDEMVGEYESHLDDAGFFTQWNDGVVIVKVGEQI